MSDFVAVRTRARRPLADPDLTCDWTPYMDVTAGITVYADCPDCLTRVQGLPAERLCPDRVKVLRDSATRLQDLVRHQRGALHEAELLTDEEYSVLAQDADSVKRLDGYDAARAARATAERERDDARAERDALAAQLARVEHLGEKITRIKAVRIEFGLGLKEAKDLVENESAGAATIQQSLSTRVAVAEQARVVAEQERDRVVAHGSA